MVWARHARLETIQCVGSVVGGGVGKGRGLDDLQLGNLGDGTIGLGDRRRFDPGVDPSVTSKTPRAGKDIITASANNLYVGLTMADLEGFEEKYPLNSRLVKREGRPENIAQAAAGLCG